MRRILGVADLWVTEFVLTYDGQPSYTVSIMEFRDGKVARETQYFGDPFEPGPSRARWVEPMRCVRFDTMASCATNSLLYQPAETLTHARMLRVRARLPYPIGPPDVFAMAVSVVARAA